MPSCYYRKQSPNRNPSLTRRVGIKSTAWHGCGAIESDSAAEWNDACLRTMSFPVTLP